jgi:hypothetical protein
MFYAIQHVYGSHIQDQGCVYEFTRRALRDAWCEAGPFDLRAPGVRMPATAREPMVRKAINAIDGDAEGWQVIARARVEASPNLGRYRDILIDYDWGNNDHWSWTATAPEREILSWARDTEAAVAEA